MVAADGGLGHNQIAVLGAPDDPGIFRYRIPLRHRRYSQLAEADGSNCSTQHFARSDLRYEILYFEMIEHLPHLNLAPVAIPREGRIPATDWPEMRVT
jgi:hypothetical protein